MGKSKRQVPKGKKKPRGWGSRVMPAYVVEKRLRADPPLKHRQGRRLREPGHVR